MNFFVPNQFIPHFWSDWPNFLYAWTISLGNSTIGEKSACLKVCCPDGHFGPDCTECSQRDAAGKLCSGNGKCKGSGTRKGNGACSCDPGYKGALCDACALGYYQSYADNEKRLCSACHASCEGHCTAAGPKACAACKSGYLMDTERGCQG